MRKNKSDIGSNLRRLDAHKITAEEYAEIPEWTDDELARADVHEGGKLIRRGRPKAAASKRLTSLRLDPAVLKGFRATGPGWQTRINKVLMDYLAQGRTKPAGRPTDVRDKRRRA
jgi:uncharacterized protein (DUF4415 family)